MNTPSADSGSQRTEGSLECMTCADIVARDERLQAELSQAHLREVLWRHALETIASGTCADPAATAREALR